MKIGIFGRTNVGKSTLLNAITGQNVAIVSSEAGTTTDPVRRAYELLGVGKVTLIDTAGFDDRTPLGKQRLSKTLSIIDEVDMAIFVLRDQEPDDAESKFMANLECPTLIVRRGYDVEQTKNQLVELERDNRAFRPTFYGDLLGHGGCVVLVCPIDSEAPEGRLILPQVQALRAALDLHATAIVVQPSQLAAVIENNRVDLVVTDSQAFGIVEPIVGNRAKLTSFSILLAKQKGDPALYTSALATLSSLTADSRILLIEHCSHGVSCEDIARVKIPALFEKKFGFRPRFEIVSGRDPLPDDLSIYSLAVQCGGCMVQSRPIKRRIERCRHAGLPITNYGMLLRALQTTEN